MKEVLIIKMHFKDGYTMREIATVTGMEYEEIQQIILVEKESNYLASLAGSDIPPYQKRISVSPEGNVSPVYKKSAGRVYYTDAHVFNTWKRLRFPKHLTVALELGISEPAVSRKLSLYKSGQSTDRKYLTT